MPPNSLRQQFLSGPFGISLAKFTSKDEFPLRLISASIEQTYRYSGLLFGTPTDETDQEALKAILKEKETHFSSKDIPVLMSSPAKVEITSEGAKALVRLPLFFITIELESDSTDDEYIFSSLAVVIFLEDIDPPSVAQSVETALAELTWTKHAKSWSP